MMEAEIPAAMRVGVDRVGSHRDLCPPLPLLPKRTVAATGNGETHQDQENMLIVPAPESSEPSTPPSGGCPGPGFPEQSCYRTDSSYKTQRESTSREGLNVSPKVKASSPWSSPDLSATVESNVKNMPLLPPRRGGPASYSTTSLRLEGGSSNNIDDTKAPSADDSDPDSYSEWMGGQDFEGLNIDLPPALYAENAAGAAGPAGTANASPHTAT